MSPLPGYEVDLVDAPPSISEFTNTGTAFWIGKADNEADTTLFKQIHSPDQYRLTFGERDPSSPTFDAVDCFFRERGSRLLLATAPVDAEEADLIALLEKFDADYGPGQVAAPGLITENLAKAIAEHALKTNRVSVLDAPDSATVATLTDAADAISGSTGDRFSAMFGPWDVAPGITPNTTRTIAPSARVCATIARNDFIGTPRNQPSAGPYGKALWVQGLSQPKWSDADRLTLNEHGVNVSRLIYQRPRIYGFRSLASQADDYDWSFFSNSRVIMAIKSDLGVMCENFVFSMLDGQNIALKKFHGAIVGVLQPYHDDHELFGATPGDAYSIDVGPAQNDVNTFANGELHARIGLRCSPFAERIYIDVAKVPITESLAA